ncbi:MULTISPECIES: hypothetical protein [unclassified Streptomyces]|uniref:hypothetical protein n=1 Tax=unclassified Streptomyces TaxID=2593676 RepID=UPI0033B5A861
MPMQHRAHLTWYEGPHMYLTVHADDQDVKLEDGRARLVPAAKHLTVRDGLHELARVLAPLAKETSPRA